ncbi:MAG TPA: amidohydrolase family protein [Mycobacterium sp.]|nr:amidohydrolase family protein [Mycobacterium sp.]
MNFDRIDLHAHYIPDFYREALLAAGEGQPDGIPGIPAWDEPSALKDMDELNIRAAVLSISSPGVHFGNPDEAVALARQVNEESARIVKRYPGRFGFFASLPAPEFDAAVEELRYALDVLGADGIVLESNQRGVYLGDARLEPIYAEVAARNSVIFMHPTTPFGAEHLSGRYPRPMLEFIFESTRSVADFILSGVLNRHPSLRLIVPHAGAALPVLVNRIDMLLPLLTAPGAGAAVSARDAMQQLHFDLAGAPVEELLRALLSVANPAHLHYGSDYPFTPFGACVGLAQQLEKTPSLDDEQRDHMFQGNTRVLLPRFR